MVPEDSAGSCGGRGMNKYIYVNVADESRQEAEPVLKQLSSAGIHVMQGNIREDKLKKAGLVLHLQTMASESSESFKHRRDLAWKLGLDSIKLSLSGDGKPADPDLLLTAALEIFKSMYKNEQPVSAVQQEKKILPDKSGEPDTKNDSVQAEKIIREREMERKEEQTPPAAERDVPEPGAAKEKKPEDNIREEEREKARTEINWEVGTIPADTRAEMFQEGMELLGGEEGAAVSSAITLILKAANQGYAPAQYQLSICYDEGLGVPRSLQEAARWREMAAYGGIVKAQGEMGYCYEWGQGVPRNIREAVKWYQLASEQGDSQSKNNLAYCYQKGRGVTKDMVQALRLYTEAAQAGDSSAQYNLAYCYWYGEGVAINKERAIELFKQSMAGGNVKAAQMMRILGRYDYVSQE